MRPVKPAEVRMLFIGEAPPASGRLFYHQDSGLYRAIRDAFRAMIATLMRSTQANVARAIGLAKWHGSVLDAPYPGRWVRHREKFLDLLAPELRRVLRSESARITL